MNYYEILNVSKNASTDEIKTQYKKLALKHHPDKRGGDPEVFKQISEAYQTLSDPEKKQEYDNPNSFSQQMSGGTHFYNPHRQTHFVDPNIVFQEFFNNDFFKQPPQHRQHSYPRNTTTTTFNIKTSSIGGGMGGFQKSVSAQIHGDTKIETTVEIRNGVKIQTVKKTNMKTGETFTNVNKITSS